jgi:BirA family biotin operon repressor/biotin-[acetyl-CoA-carboxylase] ligase
MLPSCDLPRYFFAELSSTNTQAWEMIDQGIAPPFVVVANQQTAGRGQWGRVWQSNPGGVYLSMAIAFDFGIACSPHLTILAAWGIADALRQAKIPVVLKWPNDLILSGRKLGGIKTEIRSQTGQISQAVIGVGINVGNAVPETAIALQQYHQSLATPYIIETPLLLSQIETLTVQGLICGYQSYLNQGIEPILKAYSQIIVNINQEFTFQGMTGVITGINDQGELIVRLRSLGARTEICLPIGSIQLGYDALTSNDG